MSEPYEVEILLQPKAAAGTRLTLLEDTMRRIPGIGSFAPVYASPNDLSRRARVGFVRELEWRDGDVVARAVLYGGTAMNARAREGGGIGAGMSCFFGGDGHVAAIEDVTLWEVADREKSRILPGGRDRACPS